MAADFYAVNFYSTRATVTATETVTVTVTVMAKNSLSLVPDVWSKMAQMMPNFDLSVTRCFA